MLFSGAARVAGGTHELTVINRRRLHQYFARSRAVDTESLWCLGLLSSISSRARMQFYAPHGSWRATAQDGGGRSTIMFTQIAVP